MATSPPDLPLGKLPLVDPHRAMSLFERALELEPGARPLFLDSECGQDSALRARVDALLLSDAASGDFLARPLMAISDRVGERLGPYCLTALIGNGGMGSVYRAERADGAFAKPLAIKFLRFDTGDLRKRFALEQRILGTLSHPNIASLLDVGSDSNGAPYLVMEYVEGCPITDYVREHKLDLRACLSLFLKILDAVQTAHSQLIVHRDIKPNNVFVDAHAEPKLLDFGIAKVLGDGAIGRTRTGMVPLTPEYASPEQVRNEAIGPGSDVYSLGVLLYEIVVGERPYQMGDARPSTMERIVCDTDPPRPSSQFSDKKIGGSIRDLDAIVLKAMAKLPARRYASCREFADDLRRWLRNEHVLARAASWTERASSTLRRHRLAVAIIATAVLGLIVGMGFFLWQANLARQAAHRAEVTKDFLLTTFDMANTFNANGHTDLTLGEVLKHSVEKAKTELQSEPVVAGELLIQLSNALDRRGERDQALASVRAGLALLDREKQNDTIIYARGLSELAANEANQNEPTQALGDLAKAEAIVRALPGDHHLELVDINATRANVHVLTGDLNAALESREAIVSERRAVVGSDDPDLAMDIYNLAASEITVGYFEAARSHSAEALTILEKTLGPNNGRLGLVLQMHARALLSLGQLTELEPDLSREDEIFAATTDESSSYRGFPEIVRSQRDLLMGQAATALSHADKAILYYRRAKATQLIGGALICRGRAEFELKQLSNAEATFEESEHAFTAAALNHYSASSVALAWHGRILIAEAKSGGAEEVFQAESLLHDDRGSAHIEVAMLAGATLREQGKTEQAIAMHGKAEREQQQSHYLGDIGRAWILAELAQDSLTGTGLGDPEKNTALKQLTQAIALLEHSAPQDPRIAQWKTFAASH